MFSLHFIDSMRQINPSYFANQDTTGVKQQDYSHLRGNLYLHLSIHTQLLQNGYSGHAETMLRLQVESGERQLRNLKRFWAILTNCEGQVHSDLPVCDICNNRKDKSLLKCHQKCFSFAKHEDDLIGTMA